MERDPDFILKIEDIPRELNGVMGDILYFADPSLPLEHAIFEGLLNPGEPELNDSPIRFLLQQYVGYAYDKSGREPADALYNLARIVVDHAIDLLEKYPDNIAFLNFHINTWMSAVNHMTSENIWSEIDDVHKKWKRRVSIMNISTIAD
jgi:hypothetical protein